VVLREVLLIAVAAALGAAVVVNLDPTSSPKKPDELRDRPSLRTAFVKGVPDQSGTSLESTGSLSALEAPPSRLPDEPPREAAQAGPSGRDRSDRAPLAEEEAAVSVGSLSFVETPPTRANNEAPPRAGQSGPLEPDRSATAPLKTEEEAAASVAEVTGALGRAGAEAQCLPRELMAVLNDVRTRFGSVTIVSTKHIKTDNHFRGSAREALHVSCKAVDFKVEGPGQEVLRYLRSRREVAGLNSYRGGLIHIDFNENYQAAAQR
jgi:Peptidase M15